MILIAFIIFLILGYVLISSNKQQQDEDVKEELKKYDLTPEDFGLDESEGEDKDETEKTDTLSIAGKLLTDPKLYEAVVIEQLIKELLFKTENKILLKSGAAATKAAAAVMKKLGFEIAEKLAASLGERLTIMATATATGPPGWLFDAFTGVSLVVDLLDPLGINEFGSNKDIILNIRNEIEKEFILNSGVKQPFIFPLTNTQYSPTLAPINQQFKDSLNAYKNTVVTDAMKSVISKLPPETVTKLLTGKLDDNTIQEKILEYVDNDYINRDKFIFDYLKKNLSSEILKYIAFDSAFSTKDLPAVTLSKLGVDVFNKETAEREDIVYIAIYSKFYRDLDENKNIVDKKLSKPVAQLSMLKMIKNMCTKPSPERQLLKGIPRLDADPSKLGVTFNDDTGLCNYTKSYCNRFGMNTTTRKLTEDLKYSDCKDLPGEEALSLVFGTTLTHGAVMLGQKGYDILDSGYKQIQSKSLFGETVAERATEAILNPTKAAIDTSVNIIKEIPGGSEAVQTVTDTTYAAGDVVKETIDEAFGAKGYTDYVLKTVRNAPVIKQGLDLVGWAFSDDRLKNNIIRVKNVVYGKYNIPVYTWTWKSNYFGLHGREIGVLATDVEKVYPEAVSSMYGYKVVYYNMLL